MYIIVAPLNYDCVFCIKTVKFLEEKKLKYFIYNVNLDEFDALKERVKTLRQENKTIKEVETYPQIYKIEKIKNFVEIKFFDFVEELNLKTYEFVGGYNDLTQ